MATHDAPGYGSAKNDALKMGCWSEHDDGSLIFVESTEGGRVIYSIFDMSKTPIVEYRDSMAEGAFKKLFSWNPSDTKSEKWLWHNRTAFPWDRIIKEGGKDGTKFASAEEQLTAAERVRRSREIHRGQPVDIEAVRNTRVDRIGKKAKAILKRLQDAINELDSGE